MFRPLFLGHLQVLIVGETIQSDSLHTSNVQRDLVDKIFTTVLAVYSYPGVVSVSEEGVVWSEAELWGCGNGGSGVIQGFELFLYRMWEVILWVWVLAL